MSLSGEMSSVALPSLRALGPSVRSGMNLERPFDCLEMVSAGDSGLSLSSMTSFRAEAGSVPSSRLVLILLKEPTCFIGLPGTGGQCRDLLDWPQQYY